MSNDVALTTDALSARRLRRAQGPAAVTPRQRCRACRAGTEVFSADNHISVADDIFYERFPDDLKDAGAADLVRGRRLHGRHEGQVLPAGGDFSARADAVRRPRRCRDQQHRGAHPASCTRTASTRNWPSPTPCWRCSTTRTRSCASACSASTTSTSPSCRSGRNGHFYGVGLINWWDPAGHPADAGRAEVVGAQDVPAAAEPRQGRRRQPRSTTAAPRWSAVWDEIEEAGLPVTPPHRRDAAEDAVRVQQRRRRA